MSCKQIEQLAIEREQIKVNNFFKIDSQAIQDISQTAQISTTADVTAGRMISNFLTNRDQATRPNGNSLF